MTFQIIINNIIVCIVIGLMILISHKGLSKKMDKMDEKYVRMDEKCERINLKLDSLHQELILLRKDMK